MTKEKIPMLTGLRGLYKLIHTALHIPYLKDEKPVGLLIVSKPGMGKSLLLTRFRSEHLVLLNDLTGFGLERTVIELEDKGTGFIVVPDLLRPMARKIGWEGFLTLSNILLEEGLTGIRRYDADLKFKRPVNFGIISAITSDALMRNLPYLNAIGFTSRFAIFNYGYEPSDCAQVEILVSRKASDDNLVYEISRGRKNKERVGIAVNEKMAAYIRILGRRMVSNNGRRYMSFRSINFMRRMCKAHALAQNRRKVTIEDIQAIHSLLPFLIDSPQVGTDLEFHILQGESERDLLKRYTRTEIIKAQERLTAKGLNREMLPENGDR